MKIPGWILFNYAISPCIWISQLINNKQLTTTLNLFRHNYRPVLQILIAIYVSLQGLDHTNTRPTPLYTRWKTTTDMVTLKMTWAPIRSMPHVTSMAMAQPLEEVMISTLQIMQIPIITLTVIAIRIVVPIVIIISGPEVSTSAQRRWKFTMKCLFKFHYLTLFMYWVNSYWLNWRSLN